MVNLRDDASTVANVAKQSDFVVAFTKTRLLRYARTDRGLPSKLGKWGRALRNKPLLRHLSIVLLLKIALLWLLWAAFIRDHRVEVDPAHMGSRLALSPFFSNSISIVVGGNNDRPVRC
jgi:hypothetical protein